MSKRILVVDDEPSIVQLVQGNLERHGFTAETAENGVEALTRILTHRPDLIISDIKMPEMDGLELLAHIRDDPETRDLPVIFLTSKAADHEVMNGYLQGADMYLSKPFHPAELILIVKRLLYADEPDPPSL